MAEAEAWVMIPKLDKRKKGCILEMKPLVTCEKCKHSENVYCGMFCKKFGYVHQQNWFCADGERNGEIKVERKETEESHGGRRI